MSATRLYGYDLVGHRVTWHPPTEPLTLVSIADERAEGGTRMDFRRDTLSGMVLEYDPNLERYQVDRGGGRAAVMRDEDWSRTGELTDSEAAR